MKHMWMVAGIIFMTFGLAAADDVGEPNFYLNCIDQEIQQCQCKAQLLDSQSENLRTCAGESMSRANFYRNNKDKLAAEMMAEEIPRNPHRVNYYLIKAYASY